MRLKKITIVLLTLCCFYWIAQHFFSAKKPPVSFPAVAVQKPILKEIPEYVIQTGTIVAYNAVNLVARVEGYLEGIEFTDGTVVPKGKELFVIQPQPYWEQLVAAKANVVIQKANHAYNQAEYARQKQMYKQNATSLNNVQKWYAKFVQSQGEIEKAVASEINAEITYSYTHIKAPFLGRIGRHLVDIGNLVGHGRATNLATIEQLDPIYVYFHLNELDFIRIRRAARLHGLKPSDINKVSVEVALQGEVGFPHQGFLDFADTGLNASTGTIEFRALLKNEDLVLLPGLFVQVRIPIGLPQKQPTIPNSAIQYDQIGPYVYVVDAENIVIMRRVKLGGLEQNIRAITQGLGSTDQVIVRGFQNANPGHQVSVILSENKSK